MSTAVERGLARVGMGAAEWEGGGRTSFPLVGGPDCCEVGFIATGAHLVRLLEVEFDWPVGWDAG